MLPQLIALASIARDKLADHAVGSHQKPLLSELDLDQRLTLINRERALHGGTPITEDDYFEQERWWVDYCYRYKLVRPRWMKNVY